MLRTNDHREEAPPAPPAAPASSDPLLQLQSKLQAPCGPRAYRYIRHPQVLALRGIPVMCTACRARRDWLLINQGRNTWIHCRCNNEWHEPEITRAAFDASVEEGVAAMDFDGSFAGICLE